ncbi:hypothetical protein Zmor_004335 [Zophobas morio]|uniref:Uncharacterized protein n=1 Tax=Zophobas morio TaxID=2755281 RepID=A0AA38LZR6_9CUCU|nr:hypothetical protein Zmor_004335 [Zophobas morio]
MHEPSTVGDGLIKQSRTDVMALLIFAISHWKHSTPKTLLRDAIKFMLVAINQLSCFANLTASLGTSLPRLKRATVATLFKTLPGPSKYHLISLSSGNTAPLAEFIETQVAFSEFQ